MAYTRLGRRRRIGANRLALLRMKGLLRPTSRRGKSNRIYRRFVRRSAPRPELKKIFSNGGNTVGYGGSGTGVPYSTAISPSTMSPGTSSFTRVGTTVKFTKFTVRMVYIDASGNTGVTAPDHPSYLIRCVIWTPRLKLSTAQTIVEAAGIINHISTDAVTVHVDRTFTLSPAFIDIGATGALNAGAITSKIQKFAIKFPRKVHFQEAYNDLDAEKDILYCTWFTTNAAGVGAKVFFESRLWYFDG